MFIPIALPIIFVIPIQTHFITLIIIPDIILEIIPPPLLNPTAIPILIHIFI